MKYVIRQQVLCNVTLINASSHKNICYFSVKNFEEAVPIFGRCMSARCIQLQFSAAQIELTTIEKKKPKKPQQTGDEAIHVKKNQENGLPCFSQETGAESNVELTCSLHFVYI